MSVELAEKLLACVAHEQQQDVEVTARQLRELPLAQLVAAGLAVSRLQLENVRTGYGGKVYAELGPARGLADELVLGSTGVGDIVRVFAPKSRDEALEGVVFRCSAQQVVVALDEGGEAAALQLQSASSVVMVKTVNTVTYKRMESTLRKLAEHGDEISNPIAQYLLCQRPFHAQPPEQGVEFHNPDLNASQRDAVAFALRNEISIIHGPPGTGKTHTLVELIRQLYDRGHRVLVCGPSNIAVDTVLERLSRPIPGAELLRVGHPARLLPGNLAHSLDILAKEGDGGSIVRDIGREINQRIADVRKIKSSRDRKKAWQEVRDLRKELKQRERNVVSELILAARVVVCTLHGSSAYSLCHMYDKCARLFDTVIIDEVSQSLEPQCWIPLISHYQSNISKLVIAGDNKQLPPTVKTEDDAHVRQVLSTTIFDKLERHYGDQFKKLLDVQYRMNERIMAFASESLYAGKLKAWQGVASQTLADLPGVDESDDTSAPLVWYDTQGDDFPEAEEAAGGPALMASKFNENEAYLVLHHISQLRACNVPQEAIGVISPYNAQVALLKKTIHGQHPLVEISSVDGFQGREKECIVLSLVRSNDSFDVGFLRDERRLNVAMTRARRQLCVIGNMETLERSQSQFLRSWVRWSEEHSEIRYPDLSEIL
ncbi:FACL098Cp [Eremothecium gossypii FDAG1]|nr:FACL098Cp [Eremothecium gossypii FDAG1]